MSVFPYTRKTDCAVSVQVDFNDVWNNCEAAYTVRFNINHRDGFGVLLDYNYLDLGKEKLNNVLNIDGGLTSQTLNFAGTYRYLDGIHKVDGLAGIRYTSLDSSVDFNTIGVHLDGDKD